LLLVFLAFFLFLFLPSSTAKAAAPDGLIPVKVNGPDHKKVVFLFIADGFEAHEKEVFLDNLERQRRYLFQIEPYKTYEKHFNIYAFMPAAGLDLGTRETERTITADFQKVREIATDLLPAVHVIGIMVKSESWKGCACGNAFTFTAFEEGDTLSHELGHAFAGLNDEYVDEEEATKPTRSTYMNVTDTLERVRIPWSRWIDPDTPLPTIHAAGKGIVGAFEGAFYRSRGWYRPEERCIMRGNTKGYYCKACYSAIREKILKLSPAEAGPLHLSYDDSALVVGNTLTITARADSGLDLGQIILDVALKSNRGHHVTLLRTERSEWTGTLGPLLKDVYTLSLSKDQDLTGLTGLDREYSFTPNDPPKIEVKLRLAYDRRNLIVGRSLKIAAETDRPVDVSQIILDTGTGQKLELRKTANRRWEGTLGPLVKEGYTLTLSKDQDLRDITGLDRGYSFAPNDPPKIEVKLRLAYDKKELIVGKRLKITAETDRPVDVSKIILDTGTGQMAELRKTAKTRWEGAMGPLLDAHYRLTLAWRQDLKEIADIAGAHEFRPKRVAPPPPTQFLKLVFDRDRFLEGDTVTITARAEFPVQVREILLNTGNGAGIVLRNLSATSWQGVLGPLLARRYTLELAFQQGLQGIEGLDRVYSFVPESGDLRLSYDAGRLYVGETLTVRATASVPLNLQTITLYCGQGKTFQLSRKTDTTWEGLLGPLEARPYDLTLVPKQAMAGLKGLDRRYAFHPMNRVMRVGFGDAIYEYGKVSWTRPMARVIQAREKAIIDQRESERRKDPGAPLVFSLSSSGSQVIQVPFSIQIDRMFKGQKATVNVELEGESSFDLPPRGLFGSGRIIKEGLLVKVEPMGRVTIDGEAGRLEGRITVVRKEGADNRLPKEDLNLRVSFRGYVLPGGVEGKIAAPLNAQRVEISMTAVRDWMNVLEGYAGIVIALLVLLVLWIKARRKRNRKRGLWQDISKLCVIDAYTHKRFPPRVEKRFPLETFQDRFCDRWVGDKPGEAKDPGPLLKRMSVKALEGILEWLESPIIPSMWTMPQDRLTRLMRYECGDDVIRHRHPDFDFVLEIGPPRMVDGEKRFTLKTQDAIVTIIHSGGEAQPCSVNSEYYCRSGSQVIIGPDDRRPFVVTISDTGNETLFSLTWPAEAV